MTDPRYDAARAKLRRFLPPPAPNSGWGFARQRIEAQFLGVQSDDQAALGEAQLLLPSTLTRTDASPTNWSGDEHGWFFAPATPAYPGAQGDWLNLWGTVLGVPRETGEPDGLYSPRILSEILQPTTTNMGLAQAIDKGMGIIGSQVIEAGDVLTIYRLNSPTLRVNSSTTIITKRMNMAGELGGNDMSACFIVQVPSGAPMPYDSTTIRRLVDRRKAAGTRLIGVFTATGGAIIAANEVTVGTDNIASILAVVGATYVWTITNGIITTGAGTNSITFRATSAGIVNLSLVVMVAGVGASYFKPITAFGAVATAIDVPQYIPSGTFMAVASIPTPGYGFSIKWTASTGLEIEGPVDQPIVTFDTGAAGTTANLSVTVRNATGATGTANAVVKILPYPITYTHTTTTLATKESELFTITPGKKWLINDMATSASARIRVYSSDAKRAADATRAPGVTPMGDHGLLAEAVTTDTNLDIIFKPWAYADTPLNAAYVRIENYGTNPAAITLNIGTILEQV